MAARDKLQSVKSKVSEMMLLAVELADRLDKAEDLIRRLGYCPECELRIRPKWDRSGTGYCRHKQ